MLRAIELAKNGRYSARPNPMVGAVLVANGEIIGEGYHGEYGGPHAEVMAINSVRDKSLLKSACLYVSLEPCAHHGKTPPCSDLVIESEIPRVVIANRDPFESVNGKGIEKMERAGIKVEIGLCEREAEEMNRVFLHFQKMKRPWICLKWAESQDGFIAPFQSEKGRVHWISHPETQVLTHSWRAEFQGILIGYKTFIEDDPSLDTRAIHGPSPRPILWASKGLGQEKGKILAPERKAIILSEEEFNLGNGISYESEGFFHKLFEICRKEGIQSILIEGGAKVHQAFIEAGYYDEIRRIKGKGKLHKGVKATEIPNNVGLVKQKHFGGDQIETFRRQ